MANNQTMLQKDVKYLMKAKEQEKQKSKEISQKDIDKLKKENDELIEKKKREAEYKELQKQNIALKHPRRIAFFKEVSRAGSFVGREAYLTGKGVLSAIGKKAKKEVK